MDLITVFQYLQGGYTGDSKKLWTQQIETVAPCPNCSKENLDWIVEEALSLARLLKTGTDYLERLQNLGHP